MQHLRQSTASQEVSFGQFLDSTDGDTEEGGLTIANTDIKIRKHGATTLANKNSGGATVISNGVYQATLDATDTNTAGMLEIYIHVAGALAVKSVYMVLTATAFDALYTGTFNNLGGTAQTADNDTKLTTLLARIIGTLATGTHSPATAAQIAVLSDWIEAGRLDVILDAIKATTDQFAFTVANQVDSNMLTHTSAIPASYITAAGIAAGAMDGKGNWNIGKTGYSLTITPPTAVENRQEMDTNSADLNSLISGQSTINIKLDDIQGATFSSATDSLEVIRNRGDSAWLTATGFNTATPLDAAGTRASLGLATANMDTQFAASATATGFNTVVPDAAGTAPTAAQNRQEMDSNSTQLAAIILDTGTNLPGLIDDLAIKKNTILNNFEFLMVLTSDHATPATGLTVTGQRSIDGGAFVSVGGSIAEVSNGIYQFDALAADTNGDLITWRFSEGTADDTFLTFKTVQ